MKQKHLFPRGTTRHVLLLMAVASVAWAFLNHFDRVEPFLAPLHQVQERRTYVSERIILGHYPSKEDLVFLKRKESIDVIISLLDPSLPQERALYERERKDAGQAGMQVLNYPLGFLPTAETESNRAAIHKMIDYIAAHPGQRFYIHCYLARHRVAFVKTLLEEKGYKLTVVDY